MASQQSKLIFLCLLAIVSVSFILNFPSIKYFFFQDDWFVLNNLTKEDLFAFLTLKENVIYWRPLGMQGFFLLSKNLFGLNPLNFHLLAFLFHAFNIILISKIIYKIFKNRKAALVASFVYATASFHYMSLSWLALTWNIIGTSFLFLSLLLYLKKTKKSRILSFICFLSALASSEFALLLPFLLVIVDILMGNNLIKVIKNNLLFYFPITIILLTYFIFRFVIFKPQISASYKPEFNYLVLKNSAWYLAWLFNIPDEVKYQINLSKFKFTQILLGGVGNFAYLAIFTPVITFFSLVGLLLIKKIPLKKFLLLVFAFLLLLTPVLFFPNHSYSYYLTTSSIPFLLIISYAVASSYKSRAGELILVLFICSWFISSLTSLSFTRQVHWVDMEQNLSKKAVFGIKENFPSIPSGSVLAIASETIMLKQSLLDQEAAQVIFNDRTIKTEFVNLNEELEPYIYRYRFK